MPGPGSSLLAALLLALPAASRAIDDSVECPPGQQRIHTDNPYDPFPCAPKAAPHRGLLAPQGPAGFSVKPRCPQGSHPVMTPQRLQPYRCVMNSAGPAEPDALTRPGPATEPAPGRVPGRRVRRWKPTDFGRYSVPGEVAFDFPKDWHLTDAWKDEPPAVYVVFDAGSGGKQVTLTVTAFQPGQAGYQAMDLAILKEREWQDAVLEKGTSRVAGLPARVVCVPGASRSAYVDRGGGRYFVLNYSAPSELFAEDLPAFQRLLKSLSVAPR